MQNTGKKVLCGKSNIFLNPVIIPRVHKRVLKLVNFEVQKVQKPELFDLVDTSPWLTIGTCVTPHRANFLSKEMKGDFCE